MGQEAKWQLIEKPSKSLSSVCSYIQMVPATQTAESDTNESLHQGAVRELPALTLLPC